MVHIPRVKMPTEAGHRCELIVPLLPRCSTRLPSPPSPQFSLALWLRLATWRSIANFAI